MDYSKLNKYQTSISEELKNSLPREVYVELLDVIDTIPFVNWLVQPEEIRGFAKDRIKHKDLSDLDPRKQYDDGRIVVELDKPHILENMDFFRERAIFFDKYGTYTDLTPNPNPNSEFALFWKEEIRRWEDGLIRPSDGEWIPGGLYFYWNYSPIWLVEEETIAVKGKTKTRGKRVRKFPKPWLGDYLFYHYMEQGRENGQHGKLLKARGLGFSFKMGSLSPRNMYVYQGSGNPNFHLASDKTFLSGDKGVFGKVVDVLDWIADYTPLPKLRLTNSIKSMEIQLGYQDEYGVRRGPQSSVYGISLKDNPDKARGIRGPLIHYEEDGLFPNLEDSWNINRKATEDGDVAFGYQLAGGTGGTEGASFEGSEKLFYNPNVYNIYGVSNVYDRNVDSSVKCGFFWGAYLNRNKCYDLKDGEPDVIKALIEILNDRHRVRYHSTDPRAITQKKAEEPITPQEAIMRREGNIFPAEDIKNYLAEIMPNFQNFISSHYVGKLMVNTAGEVEWKLGEGNLFPIRDFPFLDGNREGAVEIYEMPKRFGDGTIPSGRYCGGIDPYDDETGTSLGSIFIFDRWSRNIVAEYTGRPRFADEFYEICYRLGKFYNASLMYENNKKGLFAYFRNKNILYMLAPTPKILLDKQNIKPESLYGNKGYGFNATAEVNTFLRAAQVKWMCEPLLNDEGDNSGRMRLHNIRSIPYLKECASWNSDGNFDRVSAMGAVMLYDLELGNVEIIKSTENIKTRANDPYFDKFFKSKSKMLNSW
ncbi:MAG: hypothetical protein ACRCXT_05530 [Paraclostridium sp.]